MKVNHLPVLLLAAFVACTQVPKTPLEAVHVFNGTGFHGHTYPGATTPFGLVQLSPDTRTYGWDGCSGYHYSDSAILGFSHTHLPGTGCADLGDFLFTPGLGNGPVAPLPFSHKKETASPGYYKVVFPAGITAELTATPRVGVHRYTFNGKGPRKVKVDANHCIGTGSTATTAILKVVDNQEISGFRMVNAWIEGRANYLSALFSEPFEAQETEPGVLLLTFPETVKTLTVWAGISFGGEEQARVNRIRETEGLDFDTVCAQATAQWTASLGAIQVEGGPAEQFYTCFYHTFASPNRIDDGDKPFYSTLSLWDTFRSWNPLQTLIHPALVSDMVDSMLEMYRRWGELPIWPLAYGETGCMIGYHSIPVIADAWLRGIRTFDGEEALQAMVVSSNKNKGNTSALYTRYGFIPADLKTESVSQTLEMAYDDWCIARMAESLGHADIAAEYDRRAHFYQNVFDPTTGFMRGKRADGNWITPFDQIATTRDYTEAIPWQARFFVPHDVAGHTELMGGREPMLAALDSLFTYDERSDKVAISDISGLLGQYAHGNEPSHHMAWIFNWLGAPWRSQELVRTLLTTMYDTTPEGVCGNEDCGQMSAWYVLSSLGLYPVCPGTGEYVFAAPLFKKASIALGSGNVLTITADHPEWAYISDVTLNGVTVPRNYLTYEEIMAGGTLAFTLSQTPDHSRDDLPVPYSMTTAPMVSTPTVAENLSLFKGSSPVHLSCRTEGAVIRYTLDGSEPTESSARYTEPLTLNQSAVVKARAFKEGSTPSPVMTVLATKADFRQPARLSGLKGGSRYTYHLGEFSETADVLRSRAADAGAMKEPTIRNAPEEDHFGYIFSGYIDIPSDGIWEFMLRSDDGAVLDIDGTRVVDNDGSHSAFVSTGRIPLLKGLHPYRLIYFEDYEGETMQWGWRAEGEARFSPIPADKLFY